MENKFLPKHLLIVYFLFFLVPVFPNNHPELLIEETLTGKITFKVDMRGETVSAQGVFIAGSFFSTIGLPNWSFQPMCDLGTGIWQVSFCDVPAGTYQYKFVNGNSPANWEFNSWGGPCTNPNDNNNRWVTVTGGTDIEGPWCWGSCDMFCNGMSDPGGSDTTPPTISGSAPPNTTIECGNPLPTGMSLTATDDCDINCTEETDVPVDDNSGLNSCGLGDVIRTWTATDCAGNTTTTTQIITIQDTQNPTISGGVPPDVTVECGNLPTSITLTASDNCDNTVTSTGMPTDDNSGINSCGTGIIVRTWTVTDCAGNSTSVSQNITIEDTNNPIISGIPSDITVECGSIPVANALSASDNCDNVVTSTGLPSDDNSGINSCGTGLIIRTWTASDCSGNSVSVSQNITVEDNGNPTILGVPADVTVECGNVPTGNALNASDSCDLGLGTTGIPADDNSGINSCGTGTIIRTWTVTDCSGNSVSNSQTITVEDNSAPTISGSVPSDITLECGDPLPTSSPLTASDSCDTGITATNNSTDDNSGVGACGTGIIVRTWSVMDCSGNSTNVTQNITIEDSTIPMITGAVPPNSTLNCGDPLPPAVTLAATDSCDPNISSTNLPSDDNSGINSCGTGTIIRTWQVSDCQGNSASVSQTFTVQDITPPVVTSPTPPNITVECGNLPPLIPLNAMDDCDNGVTSTGMPTDDNSGINSCGTGTIIRTWMVTDCAGNTTTVSQTITVTDNTPPIIFTPPNNTTVECGNLPLAAPLGATDLCDNAVFSTGLPTDDLSGVNSCGTGVVVRIWQITDCAGNSTSVSQTITLIDSQPPVFLNPPNPMTIECTAGLPPAISLQITDACDGLATSSNPPTDDFSGINSCGVGTVIRSWTATDCSNNFTTISQVFTLVDSSPPIIETVPQDITVECGNLPLGIPLSASDACDGNISMTNNPTDDLSNLDVCGLGDVIRTWEVTDCSGNTSSASQIITLEDNIPPVIDGIIPQDVTVECGNIPTGNPLPASDDCDNLVSETIQPNDDDSGLDACGTGDLIRTWEVTDCHGNTTTAVQIITITDTTPPDLIIPDNGNFNCNDIPSATANDASAVDNCSNVTITYDGETVVGGGCPFELHRTWTASDDCGNTVSATQILIVEDTEIPIFLNPPNDTIVCEGTLPSLSNLTWEDNCDGTGTIMGTEVSDGNTNPEILTRTWIYSDNCGNLVEHNQILTVTQSPTADAGQDQTICGSSSVNISGTVIGGFSSILWTTSGDGEFVIETNESTSYFPGINDVQNGAVTLTFTAQINSGDCSEATDNIEIQIISNPIANAGIDTIINCFNPTIILNGSGSSSGNQYIYEWTGANFSSNELNPEISQSGQFILTVTDTTNGLNCFSTDTVLVNETFENPMVDAGENSFLNCNQDSISLNGSASSSGNNFEYLWQGIGINSLNKNEQNPNVSDAGLYILVVTDLINGCTASDTTEVILNGDLPFADAGPTLVLNCDEQTVVLNGGNSDDGDQIIYEWLGPNNVVIGTDSLKSTSIPGIYTIIVTNTDNGCSATDTVSVIDHIEYPQVDFLEVPTITCVDSTNLAVLGISGFGSEFGIQWILNGMPISNNDSLIVSEAGLYQVGVIDLSNNCATLSIVQIMENLTEPIANAGLDLTIDCTQNSVNLDGTGSSTGNTYDYLWSGNSINSSNESDQNPVVSEPGFYILTVTDLENGCTASDTTSVTLNGDLPIADAGMDQTLTCDVLDVLLNGGNSENGLGINYQWYSPDSNLIGTDTLLMVNSPGIYTLIVDNTNNGCSSSSAVEVFENTLQPNIEIAEVPFLDCADSIGLIQTIVSGSGSDFGFQWIMNGMPIGNADSLMVMESGMYELGVIDLSNNCITIENIEVLQDKTIPIASAGSELTLNCVNTSLPLDGSNSSQGSDYFYEWTGLNFYSNELNPLVSEEGTYLLAVLDTTNSCIAYDSVLINSDMELPFVDAGVDTLLTCTNSSILLDGGNSSQGFEYNYQWLNSIGDSISNNLNLLINEAGNYALSILNTLNGCENIDEVLVQIDTIAPISDAGLGYELNCVNISSTLDGSNSSQGFEFEYLWSGNGLTGDLTSLSPVANQPSVVTLTITNLQNGCTSEDMATITQNITTPIADMTTLDSLDCITNSVNLNGQNSSQGDTITYQWFFENQPISNSNIDEWMASEIGIYSLEVTNSVNGCTELASVEVFGDFELPIIDLNPQFEIGCLEDNILLEAIVTSNSPNLSYQWMHPNFVSNDEMPMVTETGNYDLLVTNLDNGCTQTSSTLVDKKEGIDEVEVFKADPSCFEKNDGIIQVENILGGTPNFLFSINNQPFDSKSEFDNLSPGSFNLVIQDSEGCEWEEIIILNEPQELTLELGDDVEIDFGESVILNPEFNLPISVFSWSNGESLDCENCGNPLASPAETTTYNLTVTSENGCEKIDDITIFVITEASIYAPNVFSPNGDGVNDNFTLFGSSQVLEIRKFMIFDRWGSPIFEAENIPPNDVTLGWDGKFNGEKMNAGTYVYWAEIGLSTGEVEIVKGDLVLVR